MLLGQNGVTVLDKLQAGETLEIDWVQQQYLSDGGTVARNYPIYPDQMKNEEGEMHATLRLELKNANQLNIWVESIYSLYFHKIHATPFNPNSLGPNHTNALSYPTIDDTRYFYEEGKEMPSFYKNLAKTPIRLDLRKGVLNKDWFEGIEGRDKYTGVYFNYYFLEQMIKALMSTNWKEKEIYQLIEQEKGGYQHTVHFFKPKLPPQRTIISGIVDNFYIPEISFHQFSQQNIIDDFAKYTDVELDSLGKFSFEFHIDRPACLTLSHDYNQIRVYAEPGDSLFINIDGNAFYRKTKFSGDNAISNQTLLELYHELRGDTFETSNIYLTLKKTQLQYLNELQNKKQKEFQFLAIKKEQLSPQFYQFLERHIHFQYAGSLLYWIRLFYAYRDAFIEPKYLAACQNTRKLFFRLPEFNTYTLLLNDYLKVNYLILQGRYTSKSGLQPLEYFDFSKLIFTEPENHFRIGELALFQDARYNEEEDYKKLVKILKDGCK